jgi:predicted glycosyltransferase
VKILFDIVHPADVLFFYHPIIRLQELGHEIVIAARQKDVTHELLDDFELPYKSISKSSSGIIGLGLELLKRDCKMLALARRSKPDVMIGFGGVSISHVGKLLGIPSISFYDTETAPLQHMITLPFISEMYVPECYTGKIAKNRTYRFKGHKDFSYLHPDNFKPNESLAIEAGYQMGKANFFLRIVAWNANHDIGAKGWDESTLTRFVDFLSDKGVVHLSAEGDLPDHLKKYQYHGKVHHIHHLMAFCDAYIGESATMAGEAVLLGVPAICAADIKLGYTDELAQNGLLWNVRDVTYDNILDAFLDLLNTSKGGWGRNRQSYFTGKQNLAELVVRTALKYGPNNIKN